MKQVVVAPTPAVQRGPSGPFVYVVGEEDRVAIRKITLGSQTETVSVISEGLRTGERVVTTGFARLRDGAQVSIGEAIDPKTAPAPGAAAKGNRQRGEGGKRGDGTGRAWRNWRARRRRQTRMERQARTSRPRRSSNPIVPPASAAGPGATGGTTQ